jgi:hypothetical protein
MSSQEEPTICEGCRQPFDDAKAIVVIQIGTGQQITRHRRCHMLDLLKRA